MITNQKFIIDINTKKKKKSKHNTKNSHQIIKEGEKRLTKTNPKTIKKMAIRTLLSIITLNVNGLNTPIKR